jgi:glycolate oxidase iron-sulfur subunit
MLIDEDIEEFAAGHRIPGLRYEGLLECTHCGICLSVCPTFLLLGTEADSPRGRLYYMRALAEGRTDPDSSLVHHLDACLGCRACEPACPSAVQYGELLVQTRSYIEKHHQRPAAERRARRVLLDTLTSPSRLAAALASAQVAERLPGGSAIVGRLQRFLFGPGAPAIPLPERLTLGRGRLPARTAARGKRRGRVAVLAGCVMPVLFQRVNRATVDLLAANGVEVLAPRRQGCCGSLHFHNGELAAARARAERLIEAFEDLDCDAVLVNSAGCGSAMKEYRHLFHGDAAWESRAEKFSARVRDVCEYLAAIGLRPPVRLQPEGLRRVVYHDACHLAHAQGIRAQPRDLLRQIPRVELVELVDSDVCCGSAGIYNFLQPDLATRLQSHKVANILAARPDVVATGNPGCHAWIEAGLRAAGSQVPVRHTVELLADAYR